MRLNAGSRCASITPWTPVTQTYPPSPLRTAVSMASTARRSSIASTPTPRTFTRRRPDLAAVGSSSVRTVAAEYGGDRPQHDADVEPDRPVLDVLAIEANDFLEVDDAAPAAHLPQS